MKAEYTFHTCGPDIIARVTPTMDALVDQPWYVELIDPVDNTMIAEGQFYEASSALSAASEAADQWLRNNGFNTSFIV